MELMTCLLELQGKDTILVAVNEFSKLVKFEPIKTTISDTIRLFIDMLVKHNGMPKVIVSDHVEKFTLEFWILDFMKKVRIKLS
jgi:hypothetical protein